MKKYWVEMRATVCSFAVEIEAENEAQAAEEAKARFKSAHGFHIVRIKREKETMR
jgi:hypothetical protein